MRILRWRVRSLMVLILLVALGAKGFLILRDRQRNPGMTRLRFYSYVQDHRPSPAFEKELLAALNDPDPGIRHIALWGLDRMVSRSPALADPLISLLETETEAMVHFNRRSPYQVDPAGALKRIDLPPSLLARRLRKAMASKDRWIRHQATRVLCVAASRPGPPAVELTDLLLAALQDEYSAIRRRAPEGLIHLDAGDRRRAVSLLMAQLQDGDKLTQFVATLGLAWFGQEGQEATMIFVERLQERDRATRLWNLDLLGRLGPVAMPAVPFVVRAMMAPDAKEYIAFYRSCRAPGQNYSEQIEIDRLLNEGERGETPRTLCELGASTLGRIGPEAEQWAVEILRDLLQAEDETQRLLAAEALGAMGWRASDAIPELLALMEQLAHGVLRDELFAVHRLHTAVEKVCQGDDPRLIAVLIRLMKSPEWQNRSGAATVLSRHKPPPRAAVPVLIDALKDEVQAVRFAAAHALGRYHGPEAQAALPALLETLKDGDEWVRCQAAGSLALYHQRAEEAVPVLIDLLRKQDPSMRSEAAKILGAFGPAAASAIPALRQAQNDPVEFVRDEATRALKAVAPSQAGDSRERLP